MAINFTARFSPAVRNSRRVKTDVMATLPEILATRMGFVRPLSADIKDSSRGHHHELTA